MIAVSILAALTPSLGNVWTVDDSGGADFDEIFAATFAAADGDTVLVRSGNYQAFSVVEKSLTVVAESGADVRVDGRAIIGNLTAGQRVVLQGLDVFGDPNASPFPPLEILVCEGLVQVQDCRFVGAGPGLFSATGSSGAEIFRSAQVIFSGCEFRGGTPSPGEDARPGVSVSESISWFFGSTLIGGDASDSVSPASDGGQGGPGLVLTKRAFAHVSNCTLQGGAGGFGFDDPGGTTCTAGGSSGSAAQSGFGDGQLILQSVFGTIGNPGLGGASLSGPCANGTVPPIYDLPPESLTTFPGPARTLDASPSPMREGETGELRHFGEPGDAVVLGFSVAPSAAFFPEFEGPVVVDGGTTFVVAGVADPSGQLVVPFTLGPLGPGLNALTLFEQGAALSTSGGVLVSSVRTQVLLDAAF